MPVSNCCSAPFIIGYKEDGERCSACKEHCGVEHECNKCGDYSDCVRSNCITKNGTRYYFPIGFKLCEACVDALDKTLPVV